MRFFVFWVFVVRSHVIDGRFLCFFTGIFAAVYNGCDSFCFGDDDGERRRIIFIFYFFVFFVAYHLVLLLYGDMVRTTTAVVASSPIFGRLRHSKYYRRKRWDAPVWYFEVHSAVPSLVVLFFVVLLELWVPGIFVSSVLSIFFGQNRKAIIMIVAS